MWKGESTWGHVNPLAPPHPTTLCAIGYPSIVVVRYISEYIIVCSKRLILLRYPLHYQWVN